LKKSGNQEILEKIEHVGIDNLYEQYGLVNVLSELADSWPLEKMVSYFSKIKFEKKSKSSIKVIATSFYRAYDGGTERVNAELMNLWVQMGYRVILLTEEPVHELDYPYPQMVKRVIIPNYNDLPNRLEIIKKVCEEEDVDVFVNHNWNNPRAIWECVMLRTMGVYFVQYCHGHFAWSIAQGREGLFQPQSFQLCDLVVAISETNAKFYQLCGCNSFLIKNPIPQDLLDVNQSTLESKSVLMIGRLSWEKYPLEAMRVFKLAHDKLADIELDIVGDGPLSAKIRDYVFENGLTNAVHFHGKKSAEETKTFYDRCACVLFTSKMEGYPMVLLETKAWGIPVIMYDLPYLSMTQDNKGVLTAPFEDYNQMAEHLVQVLQDDNYRKKLGTEARNSFDVLSKYDLQNEWKKIFEIIVGTSKDIKCAEYFSREYMKPGEQYIMPTLLDNVVKSYDSLLDSSLNYKVGKKILFLPMKIRDLIRKRR